MTQVVELSWWYHADHRCKSISDAVNLWIKAHPEAEVLSVQTHSDPSFFKGTLYKALVFVETVRPIEDYFQTM